VWDSRAALGGVLFALLPLIGLVPAGLRGVRGVPLALGRWMGLLLALGGIVGTIIFLLLLALAGAAQLFNPFARGSRTELYPELGVGVCLVLQL
jgi:hypothetical protein